MLQLYETQESKRKNIIGLLEFQKDMKKKCLKGIHCTLDSKCLSWEQQTHNLVSK